VNVFPPLRTAFRGALALFLLGGLPALALYPPQPEKPAGFVELPKKATAMALSHDGKLLLTKDDKELRLWDVATGKALNTLQVKANFGYVWAASFSRDSSRVVVAFGSGPAEVFNPDRAARVFDVATGKQLREFPHAYPVFAVAFSSDGKSLLTGTGGMTKYEPDDVVMRLWSVETGKEVRTFPHPTSETHTVESVGFSADGAVAFSRGNHLLFRWDVQTGKELNRVQFGEPNLYYHVLFTPTGRAISNRLGAGSVRLWDTTQRDAIRDLPADVLGDPKKQYPGDVFSSTGRYEISDDGKRALVALATQRRTVEPVMQTEPNQRVRPIVNIEMLASSVVVWDIEADKVIRKWPRPVADATYPIFLSGDGRTALLGGAAGYQVWKLER
jgi:WD40 repeat protein